MNSDSVEENLRVFDECQSDEEVILACEQWEKQKIQRQELLHLASDDYDDTRHSQKNCQFSPLRLHTQYYYFHYYYYYLCQGCYVFTCVCLWVCMFVCEQDNSKIYGGF